MNPHGKPKILFFIWALEVGGAERFLVKLVPRIPRDRFEVGVICLTRKGVWAGELEERGIPVRSLDKRVGLDLGILFRLVALLRRERPELVNTHLWTADVWARLAAILAGVPRIVVTEQNVDVWKRWYHRWIDRLLFLGTDRVVCVSEQVKTFYRRLGVPESKLRVIPNAIDLAPFDTPRPPPQDAAPFVFTCAARLHPQKAHGVLLDAVGLLVGGGERNFKVLLAGEGPLGPDLQARVRTAGLEPWVEFLGVRQDVPGLFRESDAFVLPSLYEGLPLAVLEAMAARLPVVATRVGGIPDLIQDGTHGLLVPPGDACALADAMGRLLRDRAAARAMGGAGRARVAREYDIDAVAARTAALFEECLEGQLRH